MPGHAPRLGEQLARPEQRLRRHARVVGALAADEVLLDDRDREPALAEPSGGDLAGRPGADHDDVEAPLGHASESRRCPLCDDRSVSTTIDPRELRRLMSHWATGVAVITSRGETGPRGATTNALTSLSLDPLLVLVALDLDLEHARRRSGHSGRFCVNILGADQEELARRFATKASGEEKLAGVPHELIDEVPVLGGTVAWLACELEQELDGGDHAILIGRPLEAGADPDRPTARLLRRPLSRGHPRRSLARRWQSSGVARSSSTWTAC